METITFAWECSSTLPYSEYKININYIINDGN
jgi:hypothetical protein